MTADVEPTEWTPELSTQRLRLRHWTDADREPWAAMHADPAVMTYLGPLLDREQSDALLDRFALGLSSGPIGMWAVEVVTTARFIGAVGLSRPTFDAPFTPCVEVAWRLTPSVWGNGYATEAASATVRYGFDRLDLEEIVSFTAVGNTRSRAVMERIGMQHDPVDDFDHPRLAAGDPLRPHVLYRLRR